ncbi:zingipain-2-like [Cannabis sativa]|nr:zingipain-2-like [Cannabis sativa]XP_060964159.1 zingipain-2-like [Cannabis sativa]
MAYEEVDPFHADVCDEAGWDFMTEAKDQVDGLCWAYSVTDLLEILILKEYGNQIELSPMSVVESVKQRNVARGDEEGFEFIVYNPGETNVKEIFDAVKLKGIRFIVKNHNNPISRTLYPLSSYKKLGVLEEDEIASELASGNPLVILIAAGSDFCDRMMDNWDIFQPDYTQSWEWHMLLLVGYGYDRDFKMPYWKVKNSYGSGWGKNGYGRIVKNFKIFPFYEAYKLVLRSVAAFDDLMATPPPSPPPPTVSA